MFNHFWLFFLLQTEQTPVNENLRSCLELTVLNSYVIVVELSD